MLATPPRVCWPGSSRPTSSPPRPGGSRPATPRRWTSLPNAATFAAQGTEQDALAEYLKAFHAVTPYGQADTTPAGDAAPAGHTPSAGPGSTGADDAPMVVFEKVVKKFGGHTVLDHLDFTVRRGEIIGQQPRAGAGDLTASMRARQASRGRGRSSSQRSSGGAGTTSATSRATQLPASMAPTERTERIDVGTTPPPLPSHPRPEELTESGDESREAPVNTAGGERDSSGRDGDAVTSDAVTTSAAGSGADARGVTGASDDDSHAGAQSDDTNSETSRHEDVDEASGKAARGSRRRKSRRPRARVEQASVRGALRDDDDEHDESLFGELPGHHDGGDVYEDDAIGAEHDGEHEFDDVATDSSAEFDDEVAAQAENESSDDAEKSASAADEETSGTDTREAAPTKNDTTSRDASSKGTSKGASPAVPPRASQSRKSSRPSVPSWDDIMFGGRGPKK